MTALYEWMLTATADELRRAIRVLIDQRDSYIDDLATSQQALDEEAARQNAAVLAALDAKETP